MSEGSQVRLIRLDLTVSPLSMTVDHLTVTVVLSVVLSVCSMLLILSPLFPFAHVCGLPAKFVADLCCFQAIMRQY